MEVDDRDIVALQEFSGEIEEAILSDDDLLSESSVINNAISWLEAEIMGVADGYCLRCESTGYELLIGFKGRPSQKFFGPTSLILFIAAYKELVE